MARGLRVSDLSPIDILGITKRALLLVGHDARRNRARLRTAVGGAAPAVACPAAAGALFGQSPKDTTRVGYISPEPARLNGNTFTAVSLPFAAARRCADHASSAARFSSAQSCL